MSGYTVYEESIKSIKRESKSRLKDISLCYDCLKDKETAYYPLNIGLCVVMPLNC